MKKIMILWLLLLGCFPLVAQQNSAYTIEGTVVDETNSPLPGATVFLREKVNVGTVTDFDGKFSIKAVRGDILVFSFLGYKNVEYLVTQEAKNLQIQFKENTQLDEVVVVGMGTQRKISSLGAISTIETKELQVPGPSIANTLGGKIGGIITMQRSGEPGKNISDFWIRGIGTFGYSSGALVLIDGLEGDLNSIDPADIESFSVLKDASATAVYGVRGANGVVLITTKRGESGKLSLTIRSNFSLSHINRMPEYLRAYDYSKLVNEAREVRGETPLYSNVEMDIIRDGLDRDMYPDVSWQDEVMNRNSVKQSYYASARGGGQVARYFVSLGFTNESAAYKQDRNSLYSSNVGYNTYSYRTNLDLDLTNTTTMYFGSDAFLSINNEPGLANTDYIWEAQSQLNPLMLPTVYSTGEYPAAGPNALMSPVVMLNHAGQSSKQGYKGKATLGITQDLSILLNGLKLKVQGAYDLQSRFDERRFIQPSLWQAIDRNSAGEKVMIERVVAAPADYEKNTYQYRKYHFESTLDYGTLFGDDHRVSGLVYYYVSDQKDTYDATSSLAAIPIRYQGVSSRLTYGFRDTYMIDVNFGYTGSENFHPGRQYGFFPSMALGWIPTNYEFVEKAVPWFNFLKIRGSYGSVGNDRITNQRFPYLTKLNIENKSVWGGKDVQTVSETFVGADNLAWEKAIKADIGIEARLFKERLSVVVDFFNDQRDGIFQERKQVPDYVGLTNMPFGNVGKMKSYGSDGTVAFTQRVNQDMDFVIRGNFTYSKNEVQNWEQAYTNYPYQMLTGFPNKALRGYQAIGLFKDEDDIKYSPAQPWGTVLPGDIKYKDVNGDGKISEDDQVPLSRDTYPMLMYGVGGEFRYKKVTLGILFRGTGKTDYYHVGQDVSTNDTHNGMGYVPFYGGSSGNVLRLANDPQNRWIPKEYALAHGIDPALAENPNARYPRLQYGYNENNSQLSDFWKGDARYLRLQEVTLNYNFKNKGLQKAGISSIDFQLVGNNIYVWDKVKIFDPEQAQRNGRIYPIPSVYTLQLYIHL
ncbi:MAG: TonB-dependent receptor SusC [Candidatus Ordinivivax streblomastigis]|uniref:TonB-dependent receptor SusC n=1 Tax=Candidatus Ordinivivax streblomastigis TaxID=2540710 RepID=A0A5M8P3M2_9BACT|nr:MAG: TonB-dependent receptor SusC [Candidatus Ordinivivax streblomastigis]